MAPTGELAIGLQSFRAWPTACCAHFSARTDRPLAFDSVLNKECVDAQQVPDAMSHQSRSSWVILTCLALPCCFSFDGKQCRSHCMSATGRCTCWVGSESHSFKEFSCRPNFLSGEQNNLVSLAGSVCALTFELDPGLVHVTLCARMGCFMAYTCLSALLL
eukprot:COSAG01_NODE_8274_length_2847_cov_8.374818_2_plen_161_part_00